MVELRKKNRTKSRWVAWDHEELAAKAKWLTQFMNDATQESIMLASLSPLHRKQMHHLASVFRLYTKSTGNGDTRIMTFRKTDQSCVPNAKKVEEAILSVGPRPPKSEGEEQIRKPKKEKKESAQGEQNDFE